MNKELLSIIDNSIDTVLWISIEDFKNFPQVFQTFDYLTSGILERKEGRIEGLYQTQSFEKLLNIGLILKTSEQSTLSSAESSLKIVLKDNLNKVLIVHNEVEKDLIAKLSKKYNKSIFLEFSIPKNI